MATSTADSAPGTGGVVDLSDPLLDKLEGLAIDTQLAEGQVNPLSSLAALGTALDSYEDVPTFLNSIIEPHLPPRLPAPQPSLPPDLVPIDKQLSELLTRLSLLNQDTSSSLEQLLHDVSRTVPRLTYDLQFMRESAVSLQSSLQLVQDRVARQTSAAGGAGAADTDDARTYRALEKLAHLDKLKTRMESARDILQEAESWSTLESEITSFITDRQWMKAGNRLAEASKSLVVFQSAEGEYEAKRSLLVSLQNELETALSAALKDAIAQVDTVACAHFNDIFRLMDRGHEFRNYYFAARRAPIIAEWSSVVLRDLSSPRASMESAVRRSTDGAGAVAPNGNGNGGDDGPPKFTDFLPQFYATALAALQSECTQIPLIFPTESATSILSTFLETTLDELSPSFQDRLSAMAEHYGAEALPEAIRAFKATEDLGVAVQGIMDKLTPGHGVVLGHRLSSASPGSNGTLSPTSPAASRRPSSNIHRLSVSHRFSRSLSISELPSGPSSWETSLFEPFLDLQSSYPALEKRYLQFQLDTDEVLTADASNRDDPARVLTERSTAAFSLAEGAISRCLAFTHGYGALGLVDALNEFIKAFLSRNSGILESARAAARRGAAAPDELDFEGLDYSTEDWGAFQSGLHVLQACRVMRDRLSMFEATLYAALEGIAPILNSSASDPLSLSRTGSVLGAISLLQQSTLNSAELHNMITTLPSTPRRYELTKAHEALSTFTRQAQVFLQTIILAPLKAQLEGYPSLPVWSQPEKQRNPNDLHIPTFSLSPTDTIARVSEGLLNLLRVFEVYADDDALSFSIETLPFVDVESLRELLHPDKSAHKDVLAGTPGVGPGPGGPDSIPPTPKLGAEAVLSTWVSSLALSLLSHLTKTTLPTIRTLSGPGAAQLASDLAYLSNAVRALDVEWDDVERWREAAECKDQSEWRARGGEETRRGVWAVVGMLRGWSA